MVPPPARRILEETRISHDFDVIVIGSGAGGGTFAYACAKAGKQVLLLERGARVTPKQPGPNGHEKFLADEPYDERLFQVNGSPKRLYMGGTLGGSTALYGAALLRPSVEDFHPGRFYGRRIPREIWDWPISYETLEPFYTEAENLYRVAGPREDDFGPLPKPGRGFSHSPLPVKRINQRIMAANSARGLKPFRLPLAIEFARCMECSTCPGHACPNQSRRSSAHLVDEALRAGMSLHVKTGVEAEQLQLDARGRIDGVRVVDRGTGQRFTYRAQRYALAAGAIGSPALLLRSGLDGPWVGRNYMMHLSPIRCGLFPGPTGADETFVKQLGFADYYFGAPGYPHKLGLIQSLPVPGASMIAKALAMRFPRRLIQFLRSRMAPLVGIVEDLPQHENRVTLDSEGQPVLRHRFADYDLDRGRRLGRLMSRILKNTGAILCAAKAFPPDEHVAHQCGTLRFGKEPDHAVADSDCRVFGQPNLFVLDGSVFPTSLGVGPALTIMANALRVARIAVCEI
jgi:choline dehydrogenase-like flavoprotein